MRHDYCMALLQLPHGCSCAANSHVSRTPLISRILWWMFTHTSVWMCLFKCSKSSIFLRATCSSAAGSSVCVCVGRGGEGSGGEASGEYLQLKTLAKMCFRSPSVENSQHQNQIHSTLNHVVTQIAEQRTTTLLSMIL